MKQHLSDRDPSSYGKFSIKIKPFVTKSQYKLLMIILSVRFQPTRSVTRNNYSNDQQHISQMERLMGNKKYKVPYFYGAKSFGACIGKEIFKDNQFENQIQKCGDTSVNLFKTLSSFVSTLELGRQSASLSCCSRHTNVTKE